MPGGRRWWGRSPATYHPSALNHPDALALLGTQPPLLLVNQESTVKGALVPPPALHCPEGGLPTRKTVHTSLEPDEVHHDITNYLHDAWASDSQRVSH